MEALKLMGLCVVCLAPVLLLKKKTPELALLLTLGALAVTLARCLDLAAPALERLGELLGRTGVEGTHLKVLLRTVGAAMVTRLGADLCRDGGSQALATVVELTGGVAALLIAMPLLEAVVELLLGFFA